MRKLGLLLAVAAVSLAACGGSTSSSAPTIVVTPTPLATATQSPSPSPSPSSSPSASPSPTPLPGGTAVPAPSSTSASFSGLGYTATIVLGAATGSGSLLTTGITAAPPAGAPTFAPAPGGTTIGYLAIQNPNANPIAYQGGATLNLTAAAGLAPFTAYFLAFNPGSGFFGNIATTSQTATTATFAGTTPLAIPAGATQVFAFYSVALPTPTGISAAFQCATCTVTSGVPSRTASAINFAQPTYPQTATVTLTEPNFNGPFTATSSCASAIGVTANAAGTAFTVTATAATAACALTFSDGFNAANNVSVNVVAPAPITGVIQ